MNPCPCGWLNDPQKACGYAPAVVTKYQKRISGPLLDRIDIHIEVPRVDYEKLRLSRKTTFPIGSMLAQWLNTINITAEAQSYERYQKETNPSMPMCFM